MDKRSSIIGCLCLRHRLTPALRQMGGHIGYDVRPSKRNRGYGTTLLALTLVQARGFGFSGVLITCDTDNFASVRVIEQNGGKLLNQKMANGYGKMISRYWIVLSTI